MTMSLVMTEPPAAIGDPTLPPPTVNLQEVKPKKPWYLRWWVWLIAAIILLGLIGQAFDDGDDADPGADATTVATDAEVIAAFEEYLDERASSGVRIAEAVESVTFSDGILRVVFNPARAGLSDELFADINPFDNLAEFPGTILSSDNDEGRHLRTAVAGIETFHVDGTDLGSLTTAEIYKMGTGKEWVPGT
jgi:hypothetical protein